MQLFRFALKFEHLAGAVTHCLIDDEYKVTPVQVPQALVLIRLVPEAHTEQAVAEKHSRQSVEHCLQVLPSMK